MIDLEPIFINSGLMKKLDLLIQDGLGPVIERMLVDRVGRDWLSKFNEHLGLAQKYEISMTRDGPSWDYSQILRAVMYYGSLLSPDARSNRNHPEYQLARQLIALRNDISHAGPSDIGERASIERTFDFMRAAEKLLRAYGVVAQAREVARMREDYEASLSAGIGRASMSSVGADADKARQPTSDQVQSPREAAPISEDADTGHRQGELKEPGEGVVWFPLIGGRDHFGYFVASERPNLSDVFSSCTGLGKSKVQAFQQVIEATRSDEPDDIKSVASTRMRIDPGEPTGLSFGLAAAVADRSARYGFTESLHEVAVIATGMVVAGRRGVVAAIDEFTRKVELVDTSEQTRKPRRVLFLFPKTNLDNADERARQTLARWTRDGRIQWRAVTHLKELDDLFRSGAAPGGPNETKERAKPDTSVPLIETEGIASSTAARPAVDHHFRLGIVLSGGALGVVLLSAVVGVIWTLGPTRLDPVVAQASDDRMAAIARAAVAVRASPEKWELCSELNRQTSAMTDLDRKRRTPEVGDAESAARACNDMFTASDGRLQMLAKAAVSVRGGSGSVDALADARGALTPFDRNRALSETQQRAIADGDAAFSAVAASRNRLQMIEDAWHTAQQAGQPDWSKVRNAFRALQPEDEQRGSSVQQTMLRDARAAIEQRDADERSAASFRQAAANYRRQPDLQTAKSFVESADAVRGLGGDTLVATDRDFLEQAEKAKVEIAASSSRRSDLAAAYRHVQDSERRASGLMASYRELQRAAELVGAFDFSGLDAEQIAALRRAKSLKADFDESDKRISKALQAAERGLAAGKNGMTFGLFQDIHTSAEGLTALDRERITPLQRDSIREACNVSPPLMPGFLAPSEGSSCLM